MKLLQSLKSRQALFRQVGEAAAQEERNRLARDLHDSIKQQLFSINVSAAAAQERWDRDPEGAKDALADVRRSAKEAMVEMQALLHQLRPQALRSIMGFVEALREQCEALGYRSGAQVTMEVPEEIPEDRLPPGAPEAFFRIAQEALANVARHARAHHVHVRFGRQGERAVLEVEDDGQGFNPITKAPGMGLRNLQERAESLGGRLAIASKPGVGSRIEVYIPLVAPPAEVEAGIEKAVREAKRDLTVGLTVAALLFLQISRDAPSFEEILWTGMFLVLAVKNWNRERLVVRGAAGAPLEDISRLFYVGHRNRTFLFLVASYWAFCYWNVMPGGWNGGRGLLGAAALLCVTLAGFELIHFHYWSRFRRAWLKRNRPIFKEYWGLFVIVPLLILACFLDPVVLAKVARLSPLGAVLIYLFMREPRMVGADR